MHVRVDAVEVRPLHASRLPFVGSLAQLLLRVLKMLPFVVVLAMTWWYLSAGVTVEDADGAARARRSRLLVPPW